MDICMIENQIKITNISKYRSGPLSLFTIEELNNIYQERVINKENASNFEQNQQVWPVVKTITKK